MSEKKTIGGIPVECLTGEPAAIWSGWRTLGDRELVREASIKGTHIKLAHKCLAYRRQCTLDQACIYFNKEVEIWINELLNKKQVYRASHILKNIGKDPVEYIFAVSIKSKDPLFRDYLCEYMIKVDGFETGHIAAWNIIKCITQYEKKYNAQNGLSSSVCIDDVMKLPQNIKQALCTELYFSLSNPDILENVSNITLWDYLLSNNKVNELKLWIDTRYHPDALQNSDKIDHNLKSLFVNLNITTDMIESIDSSNANNLVKDLIKNHLCRYGVCVKEEQNDLKLILNRFFSSGITLKELSETILPLASCNIRKTEFLQTVDRQLCLTYCTQKCHTLEENSKLAELYDVLTDMCNTQDCHEDALIHGIVKSIDYISDDWTDYLKANYLISFTLIFLQLWRRRSVLCNETNSLVENKLIRDIFTNKDGLNVNAHVIPQEVLQHTLTYAPVLQHIIEDRTKKTEITVYELLDGYKNLNAKLLFKWRLKNEAMPTFASENLIKKYGHEETLTYGYYLKEGRPNMAAYHLKHAQTKLLGSVSSQRKSKAALYAHVLALKNLDKSDIVCGCIAFIELLGVDSNNLRLYVTVAKYVQEQLNISIGNLLENVIYKNQHDLKSVISYLEQSFQKYLLDDTLTSDNIRFVEALKTWDIIVRFARVHNCTLPSILLKYLANHDLWFEFVTVSHMFAYPTKQVLGNAKLFNNASIREHLLTCLNNSNLSKSQPCNEQKPKSRDTRQLLYNKSEQDNSPTSASTVSGTDINNSDTTDAEHATSSSLSSFKDNDLWLIILNCHQSQDPPGALINASRSNLSPILTILATCYEPSSVAAYCYCWMVISVGREDVLLDYAECLEQQIWPANKVAELLSKMIQFGYSSTLNRAYKIFMPDNILNPFFEFLTQAIIYGEFKESQQHLLEFKSQCSSLKCNRIMDWSSVDLTYLKNLYWVAIVAIKCIVTALGYAFQSTPLRVKLLETLIKCNFSADLPVKIPDFQCLLDITRILQKTDVTLNFVAVTVVDNVCNFDTEIQRCISDLMAIENYSIALELSCTAGLHASEIILAQSRNNFKESINREGQVNSTFWMQCAQDFNKYNVPPQVAVEFFVEHAEKVISHKERYEVLKLAYETLKNTEIEQHTINTLEMAMWKSCILAGPENIQFNCNDRIFNKLKTELLSGLDQLEMTCSLEDESEKNSAEILINRLIDLGQLDIALRISVIFNYNHKDLQILMLCLSLAEGEILPAKLTTQQRSFLEETNKSKQQKHGTLRNRGLQRLSSSSSLNSIGETSKSNDSKIISSHQYQMECISILEKLSETFQHGNAICSRIVSCYKLAVRLKKTYQSLLMLNNPIKFLQDITESHIENKCETVNNIITSYKIKMEDVAIFLTENIIMHINRAIEDGSEDFISMWGYPINTHFHLIMELCSDISLLGLKLLQAAQSLLARYISSHDERKNVSTLKTIVELLIRSHDCFTTSCNMEGIASVLRKCQNLANTLQMLKHWALLVRLVTGVGRFTEMSYIFQILKENDHFEFLLGKGLDKVPGLKMALLEFLKRQCPEDKELFTLVALHFRLYYEIALMWENEAKEIITKLMSDATKECGKSTTDVPAEIRLTRNDNVQKQLQLVMTNFTHATQYYLQDNKLNLANRCSHQAQLVALQIALLNAVSQNQQAVSLLNLKSDDLDRVSSQILNFPQTLIITRAYNYHVDWANLIYHQCVLRGDMKYLKEFMTVNSLTPAIVQDCARRYRLEKNINNSMTNNIKTLIRELSDVECKYMLASQLGFKNIAEEMHNDPIIGSYLKDTIWKKGYNAP